MATDAEEFLARIETLFGKEETILRVETTHPGLPNVSVFVYRDFPEQGLLTVVTYGLSAAHHPLWKLARPELVLTIASQDAAWAEAVGWVAERFRGEHPFSWGSAVSSDGAWTSETSMSAFLVFAPAGLSREQARLELPTKVVQLTGVYPIYQRELALLAREGLERFWGRAEFDPLDPHRAELGTNH